MSPMDAWKYIIDNWMTATWQPIPESVKFALHLKPNMGMYSGMLVTRAGSLGVMEFIQRMNQKRD